MRIGDAIDRHREGGRREGLGHWMDDRLHTPSTPSCTGGEELGRRDRFPEVPVVGTELSVQYWRARLCVP